MHDLNCDIKVSNLVVFLKDLQILLTENVIKPLDSDSEIKCQIGTGKYLNLGKHCLIMHTLQWTEYEEGPVHILSSCQIYNCVAAEQFNIG